MCYIPSIVKATGFQWREGILRLESREGGSWAGPWSKEDYHLRCQWDTSPKCECGENNTALWNLNSDSKHDWCIQSLNETKPPNLTSLDSKLLESINISKENCTWCSNRSAHLSTLQIRAPRQIEIRIQCEDSALSVDSQAGRAWCH